MGYSQRAGGTHPTGMHSCFWGNFTSWAEPMRLLNYLRILGGAPGTRAPFSVQFLLFSFSFRQKPSQIIGFCPKLKGWRPCPVWEILDPPLLTNIFALIECCILLPSILHRPPIGGFRILPRGDWCHSVSEVILQIFCRKLHENERIWTPGWRPWRSPSLGSANATDAYLELKSVIGLLCWPPWVGQVLHSMENLRNSLCAGDEAWKWDAGKLRVDITRVQNMGTSGPRLGNPG